MTGVLTLRCTVWSFFMGVSLKRGFFKNTLLERLDSIFIIVTFSFYLFSLSFILKLFKYISEINFERTLKKLPKNHAGFSHSLRADTLVSALSFCPQPSPPLRTTRYAFVGVSLPDDPFYLTPYKGRGASRTPPPTKSYR